MKRYVAAVVLLGAALMLFTTGCGGSSGSSGVSGGSNKWDEMKWDEGVWG